MTESKPILNALSFDLEDYFMVSAMESFVPKEKWETFAPRFEIGLDKILSILGEANVKATFFTVGWIADRFPEVLKNLSDLGHEIAAHSYDHQLVYETTPEDFRQDLKKTKTAIERAIGKPILGYRAPSFSITKESIWAFDILAEEGFRYDSSVLPAPHARGGLQGEGVSRFPGRFRGLMEFPLSTLQVGGKTFPFSGGGYFRLFPLWVTRWGIRQVNSAGEPAVLYLHPWELDPGQPKMPLKGLNRFRHYVGIRTTERKLRLLLKKIRFGTVENALKTRFPEVKF